ncbi:hypothetical protein FRC06_000740 [Ceratobasidium sp. 370]|nr:hypothetical protein FRC06_000740 [Ceratobasidium sp. 370]
MVGQGSLQHLPAVNAVPVYGYSNNWDRLIACRDIRSGSGNGAEGCVDRGMNANQLSGPGSINDPMFFHPQHPRSVENFDMGAMSVAEKARGPIPSNLYPAYQLPGLAYELRPDGGVAVRKRAIDGGQEGETATKKRRLVADAAR